MTSSRQNETHSLYLPRAARHPAASRTYIRIEGTSSSETLGPSPPRTVRIRFAPTCQTSAANVKRPSARRTALSTGAGRPVNPCREHPEDLRAESRHPEEEMQLIDDGEHEHEHGEIPARNVIDDEIPTGRLDRIRPSLSVPHGFHPCHEPERQPRADDRGDREH